MDSLNVHHQDVFDNICKAMLDNGLPVVKVVDVDKPTIKPSSEIPATVTRVSVATQVVSTDVNRAAPLGRFDGDNRAKKFEVMKKDIKVNNKDICIKKLEKKVVKLKEKTDAIQAELFQYKSISGENKKAVSTLQSVENELKKTAFVLEKAQRSNEILIKALKAANAELQKGKEQIQALDAQIELSSEKLMLQQQYGEKQKSNETGVTSDENLSACTKLNFTKRLSSSSDEQPSSTCIDDASCTSNESSSDNVQNQQIVEDEMASFKAEIAFLQNLCKHRISPLHSPQHVEEACNESSLASNVRLASLPMYDEDLFDSLDITAFKPELPQNMNDEHLKELFSTLGNLEQLDTNLLFMQEFSQNLVKCLVNLSTEENVNSAVIIVLNKIIELTRKYSELQWPNDEMMNLIEKYISMAIVKAEGLQKPHLHNLVKLFLQKTYKKIVQNFCEINVSSSLCRMFTFICKIQDNMQDLKFLCKKLVQLVPNVSSRLIRNMGGVWNDLYEIPEAALMVVKAVPCSTWESSFAQLPKPQPVLDSQPKKSFPHVLKKDDLAEHFDVLSNAVQENASSVHHCSSSESSETLPVKSSNTNNDTNQYVLSGGQNLETCTNPPNVNSLPQNINSVLGSDLHSSGNFTLDFFNSIPNRQKDNSAMPNLNFKDTEQLSENNNTRMYPLLQHEISSCNTSSTSNVHDEHIEMSPSISRSSHVEVQLESSVDSPGSLEVPHGTGGSCFEEKESTEKIPISNNAKPGPMPFKKLQLQQPPCQLISALHKLDKLNTNKKLCNCLCRTIIIALIKPTVELSSMLASKSVIDYLILSKNNPLMLYASSKDTKTLIPLLEICLSKAINQAQRKGKPNLNSLTETLLTRITIEILNNKELTTLSLSALVRVFTLICKGNKNLEKPKDLYRKILQFRPDVFHVLFASIISVWSEVLPPTSDFLNADIVKRVRRSMLMRTTKIANEETWTECQFFFKNFCDISGLAEAPSRLLVTISKIMLETHDALELKEYEGLLEMLVLQSGWSMSKTLVLNKIIFNALIPLLDGADNSPNIQASTVFIRLIALIDQLSPKDDDTCRSFVVSNLSGYFKLWIEGFLPICEAVHFCFLQIHINHRLVVPAWLSDWFDNNKSLFSKYSMSWIESMNKY